jgi:hypothetical protein
VAVLVGVTVTMMIDKSLKFVDWELRLTHMLAYTCREQKFELGSFDCSLMAALALEAQYPVELFKLYYKQYSTIRGARNKLKQQHNVTTPEQLVKALLPPRKSIAFAQKGDIVVNCDLSSKRSLLGGIIGVCYGATSFFVTDVGLIKLPTLQQQRAYG